MNSYVVPVMLIALIGALLIYVPRWIAKKHRIFVGVTLSVGGYAALSLEMKLENPPFLQNHIVVYGWLGVCVVCMVVGMVSLLSWRE